MANKNFSQFTAEASPTTSQYVVGYNTAVSGGERRFALSDILGLFRTQVFSTSNGILQADGSGNVTSTGLTYSGTTLSVPASFVISGAGSLTFTAGGSNQPITLTPSGTGNLIVNTSSGGRPYFTFNSATPTLPASNSLVLVGAPASPVSFATYSFGGSAPFIGARANGTASSPSAVTTDNVLTYFGAQGYGASTYSSSVRASVNMYAGESWSDAAQGTYIDLATTVYGGTTSLLSTFGRGSVLDLNRTGAAFSSAAWGTSARILWARATTITDTTSSGTVATAVASSFAVPTFAASNSTTYTNAANLYVAGTVAAGTNVTITNPWSIWVDAGNVRFDGTLRTAAAVDWDFGSANVVSPTSPNRTLTVTVGGTTYYIAAKTTNN